VPGGDVRQMDGGGANVVEGSGPSAAGISETAILQTPCSDALAREGLAQVSNMRQVILGAPISAVDDDGDGMRSAALRNAQFAELKLIRAVGDALARRRWN
jgi:hypothetical protein